MRSDVKDKWTNIINEVISSSHITDLNQKMPEIYRIQFTGMWDKYVKYGIEEN